MMIIIISFLFLYAFQKVTLGPIGNAEDATMIVIITGLILIITIIVVIIISC